jgi:hypothetical protein
MSRGKDKCQAWPPSIVANTDEARPDGAQQLVRPIDYACLQGDGPAADVLQHAIQGRFEAGAEQ